LTEKLLSAASAGTGSHAAAAGGLGGGLPAGAFTGTLFGTGALTAVTACAGFFAFASAFAGAVLVPGAFGWNSEQQTCEKQCGQGKLFHRNSFRLPELW